MSQAGAVYAGVSVASAMATLDAYAQELDGLSRSMLKVEQQLEPIEREYQDFVDDYEVGLWQRSEDEPDFKLPPEALRVKLAHRAMAPELLGSRQGLRMQRERGMERIRAVKALVEAQRSILSALKSELDATR